MNKRFIELVSSRRNRNEYPNPSEFEVLLSNRVSNGYYNDPVSKYSSIIKVNYRIIKACQYNIKSNDSNTQTKFVVEINYGSDLDPNNLYPNNLDPKKLLPYRKRNYYAGFPMKESSSDFQFIVKSSEFINSYKSASETYIRFWFTIDRELDNNLLPTANNTTPIEPRNLENNDTKTLWLPESIETDNYYNSYKILLNPNESLSTSDSKKILSYDGETHVIGLEEDSDLSVDINTIGIYKNTPEIILLSPDSSSTNVFNVTTIPSNKTFEKGNYLGNYENLTNYYKIISINEDVPQIKITVDKNIEDEAKDNFEILPITHDNSSAFNYTGSTVSQQQMVCYEVQLLKLVLPNVELETGGRIALYPYVYVKLQNSTSPNSGITNIIYSNNPNSRNMLFRASIDDTSHPLTIPFVKFKGDDMVQTIKFKPNDNLRFGVYLPNGEPLKTELDDNKSPLEPNPLLQISALFSIKRL